MTDPTAVRVLVRVDASDRIGVGHLSRCLALGAELAHLGAAVAVVAAERPGSWVSTLRAAGVPHRLIAPPPGVDAPGRPAEGAWDPAAQLADAEASLAAWCDLTGRPRPDLVVVDHYGLDGRWEGRFTREGCEVVAIDDLADRPHAAGTLVDTALRDDPTAALGGTVPPGARLLTGPRHALIGRAVRDARAAGGPPHAAGRVDRLVVGFGSADDGGLAARVVGALAAGPLGAVPVDVVAASADAAAAVTAAAQRTGSMVRVHHGLTDLARVLAGADLAIGAGGVTQWERMCLGVPSVVAALAPNQRVGVAALGARDLARVVDADDRRGLAGDLARASEGLAADPVARGALAAAGRALVDGDGARRVALALLPDTDPGGSAGRLRLRAATEGDLGDLFAIANDPDVRRWSRRSAPIPWADHVRWAAARAADTDGLLLVAELDGLVVGLVRFAAHRPAEVGPDAPVDRRGDADDANDEVSFALDAWVRGRGLGHALVRAGCAARRAQRPGPIHASVHPGNVASRRVLTQVGFVPAGRSADGFDAYHLPADRDPR